MFEQTIHKIDSMGWTLELNGWFWHILSPNRTILYITPNDKDLYLWVDYMVSKSTARAFKFNKWFINQLEI